MSGNDDNGRLAVYAQLAEETKEAMDAFRAESLRAFRQLQEADPELAAQAITTCGGEASAALYLTRRKIDYDEANAYAAMAAGKRDHVLHVLRAVVEGVYL